jgi:fibronectin-binding autotransporter adhesin
MAGHRTMKPSANPFLRPARLVAALAFCVLPVQADTLYWDDDDSGANAQGGSGDWVNGGTVNWDTLATGGTDSVWTNNNIAVFGGAAGTVSLGTGIQVGGLQFDTAGYTIQSDTLTFGTSGNIVTNADATINSALAASSGLTITKTGSGTLTLGGNNTYAGAMAISSGTLKAGSGGALNNTSSLLMTSGSGTLDLNGFNASFTGSTLSSATATIIDNAAGSGTSTVALGNVTENVAALIKDGPTRKVAVTLKNDNGTTGFNNGGNTFSGGLTLLHTASGTRLLMGATLVAGAYGTGAITIGQAATDKAGIMFNNGNQTLTNNIVFNTALGSDYKGIRLDAPGTVLSGTITANLAPITFSAHGSGAASLTGKLTGSNGLTVEDSAFGTLTITLNNSAANNDYQGDTRLMTADSNLTLGATNQIPNGTGKGNLIVTGGNFKMGGFSETINGLSGSGTVDGTSGTPTLTVGDNDATSTFSGVIKNTAGTLALTKTGSGTLTLSGNNSYGGATTVSGGTLKAGSATGLSANSALSVGTGATLDLGGFNNTIKSLSTATGTITDSSGAGSGGTLRIADAMPAGPSAQLFTGSMGLQFYGGNNSITTILSNTDNAYSGGTIVGNGSGDVETRIFYSGGTIGAGAPGAVTKGIFGTGAITIGAATTDKVQFYFGGGTTINNDLVVNTEAGTDITGTFRVESGGSILAGAINANLADARFHSSFGGSISVTGAISGDSGLKLSSAASKSIGVSLNNTGTPNSYAGNTVLETANSTLTLGAANQIPNGSGKGNLIVTAGTLNMGGFSEIINGLSGAGTVDGSSGTPTLTVGDNNATSTFDGIIKNTNGALELAKTGSGKLTLTGNNTYSGATTINGGTLLVNGNQSSATGVVTVNPSGTLGGTGTIGGNVNLTAESSSGLKNGGVLAPTAAASGTKLSVAGTTTINTGSIFEWDLNAATSDTGKTNQGSYGQLAGTDTISGSNAVFRIVLGSNTFSDEFWNADKTWDNIFTGAGATNTLASIFSSISGDRINFTDGKGTVGGQGYFTFNGTSTLNWTAVPEPTSALAGILLTAGLLRRRRTKFHRSMPSPLSVQPLSHLKP